MPSFVNLPLSWVAHDAQWLRWVLAEELCPELGLDETSLALPRSWHQDIAGRLRAAGLACSVHLPFMGLQPGSEDHAERARARGQLHLAAELARLYGAAHMVGHPGFTAARDGEDGSESRPDSGWLERSCDTWKLVSDMADSPLFLENIYDLTPDLLLTLLAALDLPASSAGICFDVGHWNCFSGGSVRQDLPEWVRAYAPHLRLLHLHDNDGTADQHLGLGKGNSPFDSLLQVLKECALSSALTVEPHTAEAFMDTVLWFERHPEAACQLGWTPPVRSGLPSPKEPL